MLFLGGVVSKRTEKEIELYKELFNKAISVSILIGAGTIALWHKEGVNAWTVAGAIAFYFSAIATGFILKKWTEKIKSMEELWTC